MRTGIVAVVALVVVSCVGAGEIPDCVGAWSFDEGTGTTAADASPTKNEGTLTGGVKWVDGKAGKAVSLNGTDGCIVLKKDLMTWLGKSSTLSCWIKTKATGNETFWQAPALAGVEENGGGNDIFWGWLDQDGKIGIQAGDTEGAKSGAAINDDKWHHVALTRNMDSGDVKIFIDGKASGSAVSDTGEKTNSFTALGKRDNTDGDKPCLQADLDEVRIYSRVLKDDEIATLAKGEK